MSGTAASSSAGGSDDTTTFTNPTTATATSRLRSFSSSRVARSRAGSAVCSTARSLNSNTRRARARTAAERMCGVVAA